MKILKLSPSILILSIIITFGCNDKNKTKDQKANVLFILVDDLGANDLSCTGSNYYETPNIDRISKEGIIFTRGYSASAVCSPSRASIMTGKYTARHGITDWIGAKCGEDWRNNKRYNKLLPAEYIHNLSKKDLTIAEAMKEEGYKTFYAGKWHLGGKGSYPEDHGFDINKGGWESGSPQGGYFSPWINPKLENNLEGENLSMRLANETVKFITEHKDTNFFAVLSFYAVHGPIETTNEKWKKYKNKVEAKDLAETGFEMERVLPIRTKQDNPIYAGLVESVDDAVGKVLNSIEELGLNDKTIVIFTSDNGGVVSGDAYSTSNLPLRGGKGYQWEGGIRVPYFIKIPWLNVAGANISYPVSGTDFFPTILELTNSSLRPTEHLDGISLKALIEGKSLPDRQLIWHYPHYGNQGGEPNSTIIEGDWKLIHYWEDGRDELYNLNNDLNERTDLSKINIDVTQRLKIKLEKYLKNVNAVYPKIDLKYDEEMASQRHEKIVNELMRKLEEERIKILQDVFKPNNKWWGSKLTKD